MEKLQSGFQNMINDAIPILQTIGTLVCVAIAIFMLVKSRSEALSDDHQGSKKHLFGAISSGIIAALLWVVPAVVTSLTTYFA